VNDYLLFIDTEASGLPQNWDLPYSADANWPHAVQISWVIYKKDKSVVKQQDHYLISDGVTITPQALEIHGLTNQFLAEHGKPRHEVLQLLTADLLQYQPLIIGHFVRLDYHLLGAAYHRSAMANPLHTLPIFCTMTASRDLNGNMIMRHLRLGELYILLFNTELQNQHNALNDALATADCFFEMLRNGQITDKSINEQNSKFAPQRTPGPQTTGGFVLVLLAALLLVILIIYGR
jgi:DNA polymerase-3 subunit epsilon